MFVYYDGYYGNMAIVHTHSKLFIFEMKGQLHSKDNVYNSERKSIRISAIIHVEDASIIKVF